MVGKLMWSEGGAGYGICSFAGAMLWESQRPSESYPDWPSVVAVRGPAEKYSDDELARLVEFSGARTARYDEMFRWRQGANLIVLDKVETGAWLRKRMSWTHGPMYSPTLAEALAVMSK